MWLAARFVPSLDFQFEYSSILFWVVLLVGLSIFAAGVANILRRKTTIHPDRKSLARPTELVTTGVFRYTRNPIYLGMAITLLAWAILLENWLAGLGIIFFVVFITEYQIKPEEEALEKIFGDQYVRYRMKVGRWIG